MAKALARPRNNPVAQAPAMARALASAKQPQDIREVEVKLDTIEHHLRKAGFYSTDEIRPFNELRMRARSKLGRALSKVDRPKQGGRPKPSRAGNVFATFLEELNLDKNRAQEAQRIGTLPDKDLEAELAACHRDDILCTYGRLIEVARPYWYQASRKRRHQTIAANAIDSALPAGTGPFPLIYADPPWKFEIYSDKGLERTPDQHYPTLTDDEIKAFQIDGKPIAEIAHKDAALLMWCTSSNIERALAVMAAWGFTYKSQAVWDKEKTGLGLVFRNQHEPLLYGTRGKMPGPLYQPPSVLRFPRGRHSAKPPQVRSIIERMYPDFDHRTRLEMFTRDQVQGWTCHGYEAGPVTPSKVA